ncbi:MAG TPA: ABC transporter permease [Trebonia sp.]
MSSLADAAPIPLDPGAASAPPIARSWLPGAARSLGWVLSDVSVLTWRAVARIAATPEQLLNVTVQPVVLVLLFSYVFDGAIKLPGGGNYRDYLIAGVVAVNMGATVQGAAISMSVDQTTGLVDRLRSLPMSRAAVIVGRTLADLVTTVIASVVTAGTGLAVGWRAHGTPEGIVAAAALALLFGYCAAWAGACVGILARGPEAAHAVGLTVIVPLSLTSNAFIVTTAMPGWLQAVADWNPVSILAAACRQLLGNPDPAAAIAAWPMRHPEAASAAWSLVLLTVLIPATVWLYARRNRR